MAPTETYPLREFASLAGVTPRTVRYYISEGLLPSPGAGPQARYTQEHLERVQLIKELQRSHLPLAEIRHQLGAVSHDDVRRLLHARRPDAQRQTSALDYIRAVLSGTSPRPAPRPAPAPVPAPAPAIPSPARASPPAQVAPSRPDAVASVHEDVEPMYRQLTHAAPAYVATPSPQLQPDRSHWERIALDPDIELHIRRPLTRRQNRAVSRIIGAAREILEEDQP